MRELQKFYLDEVEVPDSILKVRAKVYCCEPRNLIISSFHYFPHGGPSVLLLILLCYI